MSPIWRNRTFLAVWAAGGISALGSRIGREAVPLTAILLLGAGPAQLGLLNAAQSLPALLLGLFAGAWIERRRRRPVMIAADLVRVAVLLTIPLAAFWDALSLAQLYVVAISAAGLSFLFDVADQTYLPSIVGPRDIIDANGAKDATTSAAEIVGPAIGGAVVAAISAPVAILVDAFSFLLSGAILARIKAAEHVFNEAPGSARAYLTDMRAGLRILMDHKILRPIAIAKSLRALFGGLIGAFYVLYVVGELGLSPAWMGLIIGVGGASSLLGAALAPAIAKRLPAGSCMVLALAMTVAGIACLPLATAFADHWALMPLILHQLLADSSLTFFVVIERSLRQRLAPPEALGRMNATILMLATAPAPVGALIGGLVAEIVGLGPALWVAVAGYFLSLAVIAGSSVRNLPRF